MTYLFKLARRISSSRPLIALALLAAVGCSKGELINNGNTTPNQPPPAVQSLRIEPQITAAPVAVTAEAVN